MEATVETALALVHTAGSPGARLALTPPGPLTIGRNPRHSLVLPDPVSRNHAMLICEERGEPAQAQWFIIDTDSRHGTVLNGVRLESRRKYPIRPCDLITLAGVPLRVADDRAEPRSIAQTIDDADSAAPRISSLHEPPAMPDGRPPVRSRRAALDDGRAGRRLRLLLQCAQDIHSAADKPALAEAVLEAAQRGTGFANAALLEPITSDGRMTLIASRGPGFTCEEGPCFSRSLIQRASRGEPVRMCRPEDAAVADGQSIVALGIEQALCVPLLLGGGVSGFLYLDNRRDSHRSRGDGPCPAEDADEFAIGLGQIAAMALSNLKRQDLERRHGQMEAEIAAAAEAQQWVLPQRRTVVGRFTCTGECRPGRLVSGDFFDAIPLSDGRLAVTVGDVAGKGPAASIHMTATQGFLYAALMDHGDPARALADLNRYFLRRCGASSFITVWAAVLDPADGRMIYVDAGHGYAALLRAGGEPSGLRAGGGPPIGADIDAHHSAAEVQLTAGDRLLIVSDGLVEQPAQGRAAGGRFGLDAVLATATAAIGAGRDPVAEVFRAASGHAGNTALLDDATAVLVEAG